MSALIKFTKDHEAILIDGDTAAIGITAYAKDALGDLVFVELPEVGIALTKGDEFAVIESVKTAAEVYTPLSGEIVAINEALPDDLDMISSPLNDNGWIAKIKISDTAELDDLMDEAAYNEYKDSLD